MYDTAMSLLYKEDLNGRLALATSNKNLSSDDSRVAWQSFEQGSIVKRGSTVSFVIDDCFANEYIPILPNIEDYYGNEEPLYDLFANDFKWYVTLPIHALGWTFGIYPDHIIESDDGYGILEPMPFVLDIKFIAPTLLKIAYQTLAEYAPNLNVDEMTLLCKLIPQNSEQYTTIIIQENDPSSICFFPSRLNIGEYRFLISLASRSGEIYQCEHQVDIVSSEAWDVLHPEN